VKLFFSSHRALRVVGAYFISIVSLVNELYDLPSLGLDYEFTQNKVIIDTKPKNEG
jgi:hypothetical protein